MKNFHLIDKYITSVHISGEQQKLEINVSPEFLFFFFLIDNALNYKSKLLVVNGLWICCNKVI